MDYCMYSRCQAHSLALLFPLLEEFTDEVDGDLALRVVPFPCAEHFHTVLMTSWVVRLPLLPVAVVLQWDVVCIHKLSFSFHVIQPNEGSEQAAAGDVVSNQGIGCLVFRHGQRSSPVPAVDQGFSVILLFFHNVIEFLICLPDTCYNFKGDEKLLNGMSTDAEAYCIPIWQWDDFYIRINKKEAGKVFPPLYLWWTMRTWSEIDVTNGILRHFAHIRTRTIQSWLVCLLWHFSFISWISSTNQLKAC